MTTVVSVAQGGTGSNSAALARTALGVPPSAAYDQANTARDQANTARTQANSAYAQANSAYSDANTRLSASGGTLAGNLIITGNLTVSGNSTTLNTEILTVEDADIVLLSNVASTPALNAGIIVNRGTSTNTFLRWDEVTDKWGWSDDGSTTYKFNSALDAYAQANSAYGAANNRVLKAGDTMTGQLNISSGGLLVTGNVGIGTSSPGFKFTTSGSAQLYTSAAAIAFYDTAAQTNSRNWIIGNIAAGDYGDLTFASSTSAGGAPTTQRMTLNYIGNLGIGTASPGYRLTVSGGATSLAANQYLRFGAGIFASSDGSVDNYLFTGSTALRWRNSADNTELMQLTNSGNLGIGTSSPSYKLVVSNSGAEGFEFVPGFTTGLSLLQTYKRSTSAYDSLRFDSADYRFTTSGTERMRLDSSGNLGIGSTAPAEALEISRTTDPKIRFVDVGNLDAKIGIVSSTALGFEVNGSERARITSAGAFLIGTTSQINAGLLNLAFDTGTFCGIATKPTNNAGYDAARFFNSSTTQIGSISCTASATAYNTSSDYRLKNTVAPMTGALAKVALLKPVTYKWNADGSDGQGFIAHELAEVVPDCVTGEKDAVDAEGKPRYQGVDTSFLVATLTAAIQELTARVAALEGNN